MLEKFYEDIGQKIKILAQWSFILESIASIIAGVLLWFDLGLTQGWWGFLIIVSGPIISLIASWILYAFGELVEKTCDNAYFTNRILVTLNAKSHTVSNEKPYAKSEEPANASATDHQNTHKWRCSKCGNMRAQSPCEYCGNE